ncbi:AfsR/SARP family transcriptional regulator, partial [Actinomycetospora atypica]
MLRPLPLPGAVTSRDRVRLLAVPSVALVVARLRAAVPDLEVTDEVLDLVAELCEVLDGLPLAQELAVAQVRALGLAEVVVRARAGLDDGCLPPRRGIPRRHRSLNAAITWSVARLSAPERQLFARLTVFAGGFSDAAAQQVLGEPGRDVRPVLAMLVEHSLVEAAHDGGAVRYRMLDTLRRHAAGLL